MADTGISWTDKVWNVTRGCRRISAGCGGANGEGGCYAERMAYRFSGPGQAYDGLVKLTANGPRWTGMGRFAVDKLAEPLSWRKPVRVFVDSMSDLFFEEFTNEQIAAVFGVMAACPQHTFQILTKRPDRMRKWFTWIDGEIARSSWVYDRRRPNHAPAVHLCMEWMARTMEHALTFREHVSPEWPLRNVWLGVSVENQDAADERIPELLDTPAAVRFLSCEPLLGEMDLDKPRCDYPNHEESWCLADDEATPWCSECDSERSYGHWLHLDGGIDWVIAGCESGPGARPCNPAWLRSLLDQCAAAGVPFFLKQAVMSVDTMDASITAGPGSRRKPGGVIELPYLDGVQRAAFPEASQ